MKRKCLDEGILQGYLDGELSPELMREAEAHLASCAACAAALDEAQSELALFSTAFAPDASVSVPTDALRQRIEAAIGELAPAPAARRESGSRLKALLAALVSPFTVAPQRAAAFASIIAVVAFAVIFMSLQMRRTDSPSEQIGEGREVASVPQQKAVDNPAVDSPAVDSPAVADATGSAFEIEDNNTAQGVKPRGAGVRMAKVRDGRSARAQDVRRIRNDALATTAASASEEVQQKSLPGEENYQQAIASLARAIKASGDAVLTPHVRADYERNLVVVDKAIADTRRAALRNPQDTDATAFLFSAYQSKIDLLTVVADQAQSSALGR